MCDCMCVCALFIFPVQCVLYLDINKHLINACILYYADIGSMCYCWRDVCLVTLP